MSIPHVPQYTPVWRLFQSKDTELTLVARKALYRIRYTGYGIDEQFRALVVMRLKRAWTLRGVRYVPVCDMRILYAVPLPSGEQAFIDDLDGTVFVLGRPHYRGRFVEQLSATYHYIYVPYDPKIRPELATPLVHAINRVAR
jgi:hypothetical protein